MYTQTQNLKMLHTLLAWLGWADTSTKKKKYVKNYFP